MVIRLQPCLGGPGLFVPILSGVFSLIVCAICDLVFGVGSVLATRTGRHWQNRCIGAFVW